MRQLCIISSGIDPVLPVWHSVHTMDGEFCKFKLYLNCLALGCSQGWCLLSWQRLRRTVLGTRAKQPPNQMSSDMVAWSGWDTSSNIQKCRMQSCSRRSDKHAQRCAKLFSRRTSLRRTCPPLKFDLKCQALLGVVLCRVVTQPHCPYLASPPLLVEALIWPNAQQCRLYRYRQRKRK